MQLRTSIADFINQRKESVCLKIGHLELSSQRKIEEKIILKKSEKRLHKS